MKEKEKKSLKKDKAIVIHPGTQAIIDDGLYNNAAKLQRVINKFLKRASDSKKIKKTKHKSEKIIVVKKITSDKKTVPVKKTVVTKKSKK